jgi:hypothetical protein
MADKAEPIGGGEPGKCGARTRSFPYEPCKNGAGMGTDHAGHGHCKFHAGNSPSGRASAHRQAVEQGARTLLERENLVPVEDPLQQLQLLAAETIRFKTILGDKVEEIGDWTQESILESEEIRAVVAAYERALDRCNSVLSGMVRLNLEDRQQKLSAAWGAIMVQLIEAVFGAKELGLNRKQLQIVKAVVARELPRFVVTAA